MQCVCDKPLISSQIQSLACGYIPTFEHQPAMFLVLRLDQSRYGMASRSISDSKVPSSSCANHWLMMLKFIYTWYTCNFRPATSSLEDKFCDFGVVAMCFTHGKRTWKQMKSTSSEDDILK